MSRLRLLGGLLLAVSFFETAAAQSTAQSDAQGLLTSQKPALQSGPTATPDSTSVPGYAGQGEALQSYHSNPSGLANDGQLAAAVGSETYTITSSGTAAAAANAVDPNASWLQPSIGASQNPMDIAGSGGGTTGTEGQECKPHQESTTTIEKSLYTCESTLQIANNAASCTATYTPQVETYGYSCVETYNYTTSQWEKSADCGTAEADANCTGGSRTCTKPTAPKVTTYNCQEGSTSSTAIKTCNNVTTTQGSSTTNYGYLVWNGSAHIPDGAWNYYAGQSNCYRTDRVCVQASNPILTKYTCQEGYAETTQAQSCTATWVPAMGAQEVSCSDKGLAAGKCSDQGGRLAYCTLLFTSVVPIYGNIITDRIYRYSCPAATGGGSWDASQCNALASSCSFAGEVCTQGGGTRTINGASVYADCWAKSLTYSCASRSNAAGCYPPDGSRLASQTCTATNSAGQCTMWYKEYTRSSDDGSGGCWKWQDTFVCSSTVQVTDTSQCDALKAQGCTFQSRTNTSSGSTDTYSCTATSNINTCGNKPAGAVLVSQTCAAGNPCTLWNYTYQVSTPDPAGSCSQYTTNYTCAKDVGGTWSENCPQKDDPNCTSTGSTCTDGPSTKLINGSSIYAACWERRTDYSCESRTEKNNCAPAANCTETSSECLDDPLPADLTRCQVTDHRYDCTSTTTTTTETTQCTNKMCLGDSCFELTRDQNNEMGQTFAQLSVMDQAGKDYAAELTIFKGTALRCRKAVFGFRNCCKDSGWGLSLGLAQCDQKEIDLMAQQDKKATHYVGTYCSNKNFFGLCLEKAMSYCSFQGSLGRIVQEAGRPQIGKSWGSAKSPDCSGFTVDQFQQLDLTDVDFSDFYKEKMDAITSPDAGSTVGNIQNSLQHLYDTMDPGNGG